MMVESHTFEHHVGLGLRPSRPSNLADSAIVVGVLGQIVLSPDRRTDRCS